ncbi:hypothetical protein C8Q80DRAFT_905267 [Daedaleopsis nitida]|nr:hypothetical protein C8Q80DRAFT_905267 [Daedaleopsis nitida]
MRQRPRPWYNALCIVSWPSYELARARLGRDAPFIHLPLKRLLPPCSILLSSTRRSPEACSTTCDARSYLGHEVVACIVRRASRPPISKRRLQDSTRPAPMPLVSALPWTGCPPIRDGTSWD